MNCSHCNRPAIGVCKFCGRGICKDHIKELPHIITLYIEKDIKKAFVTDKALFCGKCKPVEEPIKIEI